MVREAERPTNVRDTRAVAGAVCIVCVMACPPCLWLWGLSVVAQKTRSSVRRWETYAPLVAFAKGVCADFGIFLPVF